MPPFDPVIAGIARVIQLAIAPVFLLTAIGSLLGVLTTRLSRVIDRARRLEDRLPHASTADAAHMHDDIAQLGARARLVSLSISLSVGAALLVCTIIALLFIGAELSIAVERVVAVCFVLAMVALIGALVIFLREVLVATRSLAFGPRR